MAMPAASDSMKCRRPESSGSSSESCAGTGAGVGGTMMGGGACSVLALRRICSEGELAVGELGAGAADTAMGGGDVGGGVLSGSGAGVRARPGRSRAEALWEKKGGRAAMSTHTIRTCARVRAVAGGERRPLEDGKGLRQHQELEVGSGRDVVE